MNKIKSFNGLEKAINRLTYHQLDKYVTYIFDWAQEHSKKVSPTANAINEPWGQYALTAPLRIRKRALDRALAETY